MLQPVAVFSSVLLGITAYASVHAIHVISRTSLPASSQVSSSNTISANFTRSKAVSIVNPHHHVTVNDSRCAIASVPIALSHEQILARFLVGFFGGYVFAPERAALRIMGKQLVKFAELGELPASRRIWSSAELSKDKIPPIHSVLFGAFRIVDVQMSEPMMPSTMAPDQQSSSIDIAFGMDDGYIAGVHRFSVSEVEDAAGPNEQRDITIEFSHTGCNPKEDKPLGPDVLQTLHSWYAMLLFKEGVGEVLKKNGD